MPRGTGMRRVCRRAAVPQIEGMPRQDSAAPRENDSGVRFVSSESRVGVPVRQRPFVIALVVAVPLLLGPGTAAAVSDGNYRSNEQHCSGGADNSDRPDYTEPNCDTMTFHVADGNDAEAGGWGI